MKALKHLKNRFEYAMNGSGSIKVNNNDINALNALIKEENTKKRNTQLEDALILFYLLSCYKVQNQKNKAFLAKKNNEEIRFPMGMPDADFIINRLTNLIDPKDEMIRMIADELWIYQEYERIPVNKEQYFTEIENGMAQDGKSFSVSRQPMKPIPKDERITFEAVKELLDKAIESAKNNFPMLKTLNDDFIKFVEHKPLSRIYD